MKKVLFCLLAIFMISFSGSVFADDSFGNFFSISTQPLSANGEGSDAARFDFNNAIDDISLSNDGTTITLEHKGVYLISFIVTGGLATDGIQLPGPWSVGLYRNNGLVVGSVAAAHSGTDTPDNLITLTTAGQVIIRADKGDTLQVRNTTSSPIALLATVDGSIYQNTSVSINIVRID